jgi:hypothetical protein
LLPDFFGHAFFDGGTNEKGMRLPVNFLKGLLNTIKCGTRSFPMLIRASRE